MMITKTGVRSKYKRFGKKFNLSLDNLRQMSDWDVMNLVNAEQERFFGTLRANIKEHARAVGTALLVLRERLPERGWLAWLKTNFKGSVCTARRYMKVAANWNLIQRNGLELDDVTMIEVLDYLRDYFAKQKNSSKVKAKAG